MKAVFSPLKTGCASALFFLFVVFFYGNISSRAQSDNEKPAPIDGNGNQPVSNGVRRGSAAPLAPPGRLFFEGNPTLVIVDSWRSVRYAQEGCEAELSDAPQTELPFKKFRCAKLNPATAAIEFEDRMVSYLRANTRCGNLIVARYNGPTEASIELYRLMAAPHWSLALRFKPAALLQGWILSNENGAHSQGESDSVGKVADNICNAILHAEQDTASDEDSASANETASAVLPQRRINVRYRLFAGHENHSNVGPGRKADEP